MTEAATPTVSVLIAELNEIDVLETIRCIGPGIEEIVVVDDASDKMGKVLAEIKEAKCPLAPGFAST